MRSLQSSNAPSGVRRSTKVDNVPSFRTSSQPDTFSSRAAYETESGEHMLSKLSDARHLRRPSTLPAEIKSSIIPANPEFTQSDISEFAEYYRLSTQPTSTTILSSTDEINRPSMARIDFTPRIKPSTVTHTYLI